MAWTKLPAEIRSAILKNVAEDYKSSSTQPYLRARYATVCREWQSVFEAWNFQRLVFDQDGISGLEEFLGKEENKHRRDYLLQIFLRIRLDEYDCTVCGSKEDDTTVAKNNEVFSKAIWKLMTILSKWAPFTHISAAHRRSQEGLCLYLGGYSPSDCKHAFKEFHFERGWQNIARYRENLRGLNDPDHGWVNGHRAASSISLESKQRVFGTLTLSLEPPEQASATMYRVSYDFQDYSYDYQGHTFLSPNLRKDDLVDIIEKGANGWWLVKGPAGHESWVPSAYLQEEVIPLPKVEVVTGLFIHRKYRRRIAADSISNLVGAFQRLERFRHEGWHGADPQGRVDFEKGYKILIQKLPSTLRSLFIFEDSTQNLDPLQFLRQRIDESLNLGAALSRSSRSLEHLSAAFLVDAIHFFVDFWPNVPNIWPNGSNNSNTIPWTNLRTIALTCRVLSPKCGGGIIRDLVIAAARAAALMPKLEVMEIWNGNDEHGCVFRYTNLPGKPPQITVTSNWRLPIDQNGLASWANLPQHWQHPHGSLTIKYRKTVVRENGTPYSAVLHNMFLRKAVLNRASLGEVFWEEEERRIEPPVLQEEGGGQ